MRNRMVGLILVGGLLAGCSSGGMHCEAGSGPETVIIDASGLVEPGSEIEACFVGDRPDDRDCNRPGESEVGVSWRGEYPRSVHYEVTRRHDSGLIEVVRDGEYTLQCVNGSVRLEFGNEQT